MNKTGHTSGPWTATTFEPESGKEHYVRAGAGSQVPVCTTGRWDMASAADARLIAAAPALFEEVRVLADSFPPGPLADLDRYEKNFTGRQINTMRAAIALTRGY